MKRFQVRLLSLLAAAAVSPVVSAQSSSGPALNEFDCTIDGFATEGYCVAPSAGGSRTDTRAYMGLVWELGGKQGAMPHLAFGLSSLRVRSNDRVEGGDIEFRLSIFNGIEADSLRLAYVNGNRVMRANVGGGYSFSHADWLATASVQSSYVRAGTDFLISNKAFLPFVELNTLGRPRAATGGTCSSGSLIDWNGSSSSYDYNTGYSESQIFLDGKTCYTDLGSGSGL